MTMTVGHSNALQMRLSEKFWQVNWSIILLLCLAAAVGVAMLYSAANGSWEPWAARQAIRFAVGMVILLSVAVVDIRFWLRYAYVFYFLSLFLLAVVEVMGITGMGAQRWLDLGLFQLQPSEIMKVTLVLALALLPNPKWWTLGVGIFNYAEMLKGYSMPEMLAAAVLGIVPSLIAFSRCQKALFSVSLSGAVKG